MFGQSSVLFAFFPLYLFTDNVWVKIYIFIQQHIVVQYLSIFISLSVDLARTESSFEMRKSSILYISFEHVVCYSLIISSSGLGPDSTDYNNE